MRQYFRTELLWSQSEQEGLLIQEALQFAGPKIAKLQAGMLLRRCRMPRRKTKGKNRLQFPLAIMSPKMWGLFSSEEEADTKTVRPVGGGPPF